jgi:hypothetical protein
MWTATAVTVRIGTPRTKSFVYIFTSRGDASETILSAVAVVLVVSHDDDDQDDQDDEDEAKSKEKSKEKQTQDVPIHK